MERASKEKKMQEINEKKIKIKPTQSHKRVIRESQKIQ
jgi:hypothetical protein